MTQKSNNRLSRNKQRRAEQLEDRIFLASPVLKIFMTQKAKKKSLTPKKKIGIIAPRRSVAKAR